MIGLLAQVSAPSEVVVTDFSGAARDWIAGAFVAGLGFGVALLVPVLALCVVTMWRGR